MNWIQSIVTGFVCGLCEPSPLSADAHRGLLRHFFDLEPEDPLLLLLCHCAVLAVLLGTGRLDISGLRRTAKLRRIPKRRRTVHPNLNQAGTLRLLRVAVVPAILGRLLSWHFAFVADRLWMLVLTLLCSGLLLWLPSLFRTANKDGRHLSGADGLLLGLGAMTAALPGFSPVGGTVSLATLRGAHRSYALRFAWLLLCVSLAAAIGVDLLALAGAGARFDLGRILSALLGGAAAAVGAYLAVCTMRALTRPGTDGFSGFGFYNWGLALLCAALFLLV